MLKKYTMITALAAMVIAIGAIPAESRTRPAREISPVAVQINLPAYRLDLYYKFALIKSYPVAIGRFRYKSPIWRDFYMAKIEWNPWWYPPDAGWARGSKNTPPGPDNPLGPVKMILSDGILIHGTNKPESIGLSASHGCIRMLPDDARDLAMKIMTLEGTQEAHLTPEQYASTPSVTYKVALKRPVLVKIVYNRIEVMSDAVLIHPDPYRKQKINLKSVMDFLAESGVADEAIDDIELSDAVKSATKTSVRVPIKSELSINK